MQPWSGPGGDPPRSVPPHLQIRHGAVCAVCSECLGIAPKGSDGETAAGIDALAAFIKEIGLPTSFAELGIPADTDFRAVADSTNITAGCCKKLTHDEIYEILQECL